MAARCAGGECAYNRPNFTITAQGVLSVVLALGVQDHRLAERTHRPHVLLAGAGHGAHQRGQRGRTQSVQRQLEFLPRDPVVPVLGDLPVPRRLHAHAQRSRANRRRRGTAVEARADLDRYRRHRVLPVSDGGPAHVAVVARVRRRVPAARDFDQRRRARHLARAAPGADRVSSAPDPGRFRIDQALRVSARAHPRPVREARGEDRRGRACRGDPEDARRAVDTRRDHQTGEGRPAMTALLIQYIAPLMFATLVVVLLLGYPVAFSLAAVGVAYAILGIKLGLLPPELIQALPERLWGVMSNDTLLCVPFFTFMGLILERSGMAEDLLETIGQVFGPVRGGIAYAVIFVGALLAATTGVVAASVISMGLISLPIMLRYGYDRRFASGVIAASGTLAQIIPPSLVLIIMADQLGRSVGDMYQGAFIPGLSLAALYALYVLATTIVRPDAAPGLPPEALTMREENGSAGYPSLAVIVALAAIAAVALTAITHPIWSCGIAGLGAYLVAMADRYLHLRL